MTHSLTAFQRVAAMNVAFGNKAGNPLAIDVQRVRSQCKNILDEFVELQKALGASPETLKPIIEAGKGLIYIGTDIDVDGARDALCDIQVFGNGAHHFMGYDADRDMNSVVDGVMTRFIKDEADKAATIAKHAAKGVTDVYFEGEFPTMVMKSAVDQPDAPKGKFLKSASFSEPVFYQAGSPDLSGSLCP